MKKIFTLLLLLTAITYGCAPANNGVKIYPLSPFNTTVTFSREHDILKDPVSSIRTQYYIVDEDVSYNDRSKLLMQDYIEKELKSDLHSYKVIYFVFYKGSFSFSKNSNQSKQELEDKHANDKIAEFEWQNAQRYNFDFYKDGTYFDAPRD